MICGQTDHSPLVLAYLGDSYFETIAREYLISGTDVRPAELNQLAKEIVTASSQASIAEKMLPLLTEEEKNIYKAGRNAKSPHRSRTASAIAYRMATGLECLFGYFWLNGMQERAKELFLSCVASKEEEAK